MAGATITLRNRGISNNWIRKAGLSIILFFYIYQCSLLFLGLPPSITSQRIVILLLLLSLPLLSKNNQSKYKNYAWHSYKVYLIINIYLLFYSLLLLAFIGLGDGMHIVIVLLNVLSLCFLGGWLLLNIFKSFDEFMSVLLLVSLAQCLTVWLCTVNPDIGLKVDSLFGQEEYFQEARRGYAGGISCITSFGAIKLSLGLIATLYFIINQKHKLLYFILYFFIGLTDSMVARTGLVFTLTGLFCLFIYSIRQLRFSTVITISIVVLLIIGFLYWLIFVQYASFFQETFSRMFYLFEVGVDVAFMDGYLDSDTTYVPSLEEAFWGTGMTSGVSGNGIKVNVDGGVRRLYAGYGLPNTILFYVSFIWMGIKMFFKLKDRSHKFLLFVLFMFLGISEFKEPTFYNTYTLGVFYIFTVLLFDDEKKYVKS